MPIEIDPNQETTYIETDCETTGTGSDAQIWQIAYRIVRGGSVRAERTWLVRHTRMPDPWVLENTKYLAPPAWPVIGGRELLEAMIADVRAAESTAGACEAFISGANPCFDKARLDHHMELHGAGLEPFYSYRAVDVENHAQALFNLASPPRLKECAALLGIDRNGDSHDARSDMDLSHRCHERLMRISAVVEEHARAALDRMRIEELGEGRAA